MPLPHWFSSPGGGTCGWPTASRFSSVRRFLPASPTYSQHMPALRWGKSAALCATLGLLTAANVLNNRGGPRSTVPVSLAATAVMTLSARAAGQSWESLGLGYGPVRRGLRHGLGAAAGVGVVYTAGVLLPATRPLFADQRAAPQVPRLLRQALVDVPLGTVVLEEVGFRGVLPALLREKYGPWAARTVPVALFGLWHVLPSAELARSNPALAGATVPHSGEGRGVARVAGAASAVVTTSAGGVLFAVLRHRSGSLAAPALLHTAFNSLGYVAAWAVNRR